jgi:hypothetical protein
VPSALFGMTRVILMHSFWCIRENLVKRVKVRFFLQAADSKSNILFGKCPECPLRFAMDI